jgi:Recombinase
MLVGVRKVAKRFVIIDTEMRELLATLNTAAILMMVHSSLRTGAGGGLKQTGVQPNLLPIIREAQEAGARTLWEIAEALNARGIPTARGGQWHAQSVANVLARA